MTISSGVIFGRLPAALIVDAQHAERFQRIDVRAKEFVRRCGDR
jgi:hypothetical protein